LAIGHYQSLADNTKSKDQCPTKLAFCSRIRRQTRFQSEMKSGLTTNGQTQQG